MKRNYPFALNTLILSQLCIFTFPSFLADMSQFYFLCDCTLWRISQTSPHVNFDLLGFHVSRYMGCTCTCIFALPGPCDAKRWNCLYSLGLAWDSAGRVPSLKPACYMFSFSETKHAVNVQLLSQFSFGQYYCQIAIVFINPIKGYCKMPELVCNVYNAVLLRWEKLKLGGHMHYAHSQAQINTVQGKHFCHSQFGNPKALHGRFLKFTNVCKNSFHSNCLLCTSWRMRIVDCVNSCSNRLLATPLPSEKLRPHPPATLIELKNP